MPIEADASSLGLTPDRVELWLMDPSLATSRWVDRHVGLLAPDERARLNSVGSSAFRHEYVCTRIMQRLVLSCLTGTDPAMWRFAPGPRGKPEVVAPAGQRRLAFNISHTRGLVALAACRDAAVGIDVEALDSATDVAAVARRFFAPGEAEALMKLEPERRPVRFLQHWCLREACLKAIGTGLASPLAAARFDFQSDGSFTASLDPGLGDAGRWSFASLMPTPQHVLAAALYTAAPVAAPPGRLAIRPRWFSP